MKNSRAFICVAKFKHKNANYIKFIAMTVQNLFLF